MFFILYVLLGQNVCGYEFVSHFGEFGYAGVREPCEPHHPGAILNQSCLYCIVTIVDNLHTLTTASCFYNFAFMKLGSKLDVDTVLELGLFTETGNYEKYNEEIQIVSYPYHKYKQTIFFPDGLFSIQIIDDFALFSLPSRLNFSDDVYTVHWPANFDKDLDAVLDDYEINREEAYVWIPVKSYHPPYLGTISGHAVSLSECKKLRNCTEVDSESQACFALRPDYNVRCINHSKEASGCDRVIAGSAVVIQDVVCGLAKDCFNGVTAYQGLGSSFKLVHDRIAKKKHIRGEANVLSVNTSMALTVVVCLISLVIGGLFFAVKKVAKRYRAGTLVIRGRSIAPPRPPSIMPQAATGWFRYNYFRT